MHAFRRLITLCMSVTALPTGSAAAQAPAARPDCKSAPFRQFDFWVGDWVVTSPRKDTVGTNRVTLEEDGCIVHEHWKGSKGGTGQSFNYYDRQDAKWHQIWIDNAGSALNLAGEYAEGELRYQGATHSTAGTSTLHRLSFTPNPDGTVRQFWQTSIDGGKTWSVAFDGLYHRTT